MSVSDFYKSLREHMDGKEIRATESYQTTVMVDGDKVISNGEQIDTLDSEEKISSLQDDLTRQEFGSKQRMMNMLEEEFGGEL